MSNFRLSHLKRAETQFYYINWATKGLKRFLELIKLCAINAPEGSQKSSDYLRAAMHNQKQNGLSLPRAADNNKYIAIE